MPGLPACDQPGDVTRELARASGSLGVFLKRRQQKSDLRALVQDRLIEAGLRGYVQDAAKSVQGVIDPVGAEQDDRNTPLGSRKAATERFGRGSIKGKSPFDAPTPPPFGGSPPRQECTTSGPSQKGTPTACASVSGIVRNPPKPGRRRRAGALPWSATRKIPIRACPAGKHPMRVARSCLGLSGCPRHAGCCWKGKSPCLSAAGPWIS